MSRYILRTTELDERAQELWAFLAWDGDADIAVLYPTEMLEAALIFENLEEAKMMERIINLPSSDYRFQIRDIFNLDTLLQSTEVYKHTTTVIPGED